MASHSLCMGTAARLEVFVSVDDLVDGLIQLMNGDHCGPINLGNPDEFTIRQLAELIRAKINPDLPLIYGRFLPQDDPTQRKPLITLKNLSSHQVYSMSTSGARTNYLLV